ncbi:hypothetical protein DPMN_084843 [Dreissena polymorpha]|uniref:Uncharacterized protein n=1 Tax=Dreissena polymorpha TaxID=45954 RepID=A0A9D4BJS0_DREPO|nr:hypothetical protein DPMN_084843 [Dreissena polymorpha]
MSGQQSQSRDKLPGSEFHRTGAAYLKLLPECSVFTDGTCNIFEYLNKFLILRRREFCTFWTYVPPVKAILTLYRTVVGGNWFTTLTTRIPDWARVQGHIATYNEKD